MKLHELSSGETLDITTRADLQAKSAQVFLARNHGAKNIVCGCALDHGYVAFVDPRHKPNGGFTGVREDCDEHLPSCVLRRTGDHTEREELRASSILSVPSARARSVLDASIRDEWSRRDYDSFSGYGMKVLSLGMAEAMRTANPSGTALRNATTEECMRGFDAAIRHLLFVGGADGYESARRQGTRLRFGLIYDGVRDVANYLNGHVNAYWWEGGFRPGIASVLPSSLAEAIAGISIFGRVAAPPYFVLAVVDGNGRLVRIFLHQVYVTAEYFMPAESGAEVAYAAELLAGGAIVIKPVRMEDATDVLAHLGLGLPPGVSWGFRPDYFVIRNGLLFVRELRGFRVGERPYYDRLLDRKAPHYRSLFPGRPDAYEEIDGTGGFTKPLMPRPERWPWSTLRFEQIPIGIL